MPRELKTHCIHGHEYTPENTIIKKRSGVPIGKGCRACHYAANERSVQRKITRYKAEHGIES
ncbi:hypothetical protein AWH04_13235 [Rhodococcus erythropolis]|nr:hypothetical protein AWH04_13235 [Rhodococcus erythropolis]